MNLYLTLGFGLTFLGTDLNLNSLQNKHVNLLRCVLTKFLKVGTGNHLYLGVQYGTPIQVHSCDEQNTAIPDPSLLAGILYGESIPGPFFQFFWNSQHIILSVSRDKFSFLPSASSHIYSHQIKWPVMKQLLGESIHQTSEAGVFTETRGVPCQKISLIP